jgi:hypothetical protein
MYISSYDEIDLYTRATPPKITYSVSEDGGLE